ADARRAGVAARPALPAGREPDARTAPAGAVPHVRRHVRVLTLVHVASRPMRELRPGVWHWQSPHPEWNEEKWWPELVSSYAIGLGDDFLLFDPLSVPDELRKRATPVVLTAPYHERD